MANKEQNKLEIPATLTLTQSEHASLWTKLDEIFQASRKNNDDKPSFRGFVSNLLHEICDMKIAEMKSTPKGVACQQ
jgi:hypothetical protein